MRLTRAWLTTALFSAMTLNTAMAATTESTITSDMQNHNAPPPMTSDVVEDARVAAQRFVEHVNYARVALGMKDAATARQHVVSAQNMLNVLEANTAENRKVSRVESGRVSYEHDKENNHYYPVETGPIKLKKVSSGPIWAGSKGVAVTDAEIVYLTVDVNGGKPEKLLTEANAQIAKNDLTGAQDTLASLVNSVISVDTTAEAPLDKARDNMALARSFIAAKNFDGARFALKHADDALNTMANDDKYKSHHPDIAGMRKDVGAMQDDIERKDPTMLEKADATIETWWNQMKDWTQK